MRLFPGKITASDGIALSLVAAAFCLGFCFWGYYPAGYFHDDAIYWLLSQSIRQGRYVLLSDPSLPVFINYMPGYPLLLAAVGWLDGFAAGKFLSLSLTAASGILAWIIIRRWEKGMLTLLALAWFVFQPLLLRSSAVVLSEPLFLALTLFCFALHGRNGPAWEDFLLALAAGYACLVRPAGFLLGGAIFMDSLLRRDFRRAGILAAGLVLFQGGFSLVSASLGHGASSFFGQWRLALSGAPSGAFLSLLRDNLSYYGNYVSWMVLFPLGRWASALHAAPWLGGLLGILFLGFILRGAFAAIKRGQAAWLFFFVFQAILLTLWLRPDPRYVQPLIFPAILFFLGGISAMFSGAGGVRAKIILASLGVVLCLASGARGVADSRRGIRPRLPEETLSWVRAELPPDAVIAGEMSSMVYLQTGRRGTNFLRSYDPEDFFAHWLERGVSYILVEQEPPRQPARPDANDWNSVARLMLTQPGRYAKIRSFDHDKLDLFAVKEDPGKFRRAYVFYREGVAAARAGDWPRARDYFQSAVEESPGMSGAYDRLAEAAARLSDDALSRASLAEGLARWPSSPLLRYHTYMMKRQSGEPDAARELDAALSIAQRYGYWPLLWQIARAEQ